MNNKRFTIDASTKTLGRISTEAAILLMGKNNPHYTPNVLSNNFVIIINSDRLYLSGTKELSKKYWRHSGYPGGIKEVNFSDLKKKDCREIIKKSIFGMLPNNRLRKEMMKNLKIYKNDENSGSEVKNG